MRLPLDSIYITNPHGQPGYGRFGKHMGVDLRASVGTSVYAPGSGRVTECYVGSSETQVLSMRIGDKEHRFLHLSSMYPRVGDNVSEGQVIAKSGNSGNVAAHLHWDIRVAGTSWSASANNYFNPVTLYSSLFNPAKSINTSGEEMFKTDQEVQEAYMLVRGSIGTAPERMGWIGQSKQRFFQVALPEANSTRQQLADVKKALTDLQNQPPKVVVKEVERIVKEIVEVPVEKITIKEVEVIKEVEPTWLKIAVDFIRRVLRLKEEQ
tara:strand:- start:114 stop:911 length:798 start_codon:yes stop_codon:yes gene_type:complete